VAKRWFSFQASLDQTPEEAKAQYNELVLAVREYEFFLERAEEVGGTQLLWGVFCFLCFVFLVMTINFVIFKP
jgi:hypothetical protein